MIWVTCCSARVHRGFSSATSSSVHSLKRYMTVLSAGARQFTCTGRASESPCASGVIVNGADPPLASVPWQFAQSSDFAPSYAGIWSLA